MLCVRQSARSLQICVRFVNIVSMICARHLQRTCVCVCVSLQIVYMDCVSLARASTCQSVCFYLMCVHSRAPICIWVHKLRVCVCTHMRMCVYIHTHTHQSQMLMYTSVCFYRMCPFHVSPVRMCPSYVSISMCLSYVRILCVYRICPSYVLFVRVYIVCAYSVCLLYVCTVRMCLSYVSVSMRIVCVDPMRLSYVSAVRPCKCAGTYTSTCTAGVFVCEHIRSVCIHTYTRQQQQMRKNLSVCVDRKCVPARVRVCIWIHALAADVCI